MSWLSRTVKNIGEFHHDVTTFVAKVSTAPGTLVEGHDVVKEDYSSRFGQGTLKSVSDFNDDVVKSAVYPVVGSYNSVTGHKWHPEAKTDLGADVIKISSTSADSTHLAGKGFANAISLGYASKVTDVFRDKDHKEAGGHYHEYEDAITVKNKNLEKFDDWSKKGGEVLGTLYGVKVATDKVSEISKSSGIDVGAVVGLIPPVDNGNKSVETDGGSLLSSGLGFGSSAMMMIIALAALFMFGKYLKPGR
jgi:hypothetical protein